MAKSTKTRFDTLALHAGQRPDPVHGARAVPIYQTASYVFKDSEQAASLFNMERPGHAYSRLSNPTTAVLEERVAALEDGVGGIATASGQAALHLAITTIMDGGSHIVSSSAIYGGSHNLLQYTLPRFGIDTTFVSPRDIDGIRNAIQPNTRMIFGEVIGNPGNDIMNLPVVAEIARENKIPLVIDSTFTTPYLCKPFDYGANIIMHSATKFLCGHGTVIGGVLVDHGRFDWEQSGKFSTLSDPYKGFHNMSFDEESSQGAFLLRARREGMRDFGACMSPTTAFYILQGVETLSLRMERHVSNTRKVIEFLQSSDAVADISYPELPDHPDYQLALELLPRGAGSVFSFTQGGYQRRNNTYVHRPGRYR
jgi:O-acetylhomoserine (thiol)-lyase